MNNIHTQKFFI